MKRLSRLAFAGSLVFGFTIYRFIIPWGLTYYVNRKYAPEIHVDHSSLVWFDCARLSNVQITKPTMSGTIKSAVACYREKTIEANGGKIDIVISKSSGINNTHGFSITAKNIDVHVTKGNVSADLFGATINSTSICAGKAFVYHQKADAVISNLCIDRKNNTAMALSGSITPKFEIKGHSISDISFTSLFKASKTEMSVGEIRYEDSIASNVNAAIQDDFVSISIGSLIASHKKLFSSPLTVRNIKISGLSQEDPLSSKIVVSISDKITLLADIEKMRVSGKDTCSNWFDVVPNELKSGQISQMKVKGLFGFDVQLMPVSLKINSTCVIDGPTPQFITDLRKPFKYTAYHPDGTPFERTSGPGTNDWIPLDFVYNMATALTITEDPGFWHHRGIIPQALENSLKDDMRLGRFFRGGSTITMQLAKNLWLNRSRTLGRKLQEGILTIALESGLTKEKILELYLNVVEFGPNTYGIGPGCAKFLKKYPGEISLSEAMYMAIRLPSPNKIRSYESSKGFIKKLIAIGVATGKISEYELAIELQAEQAKEQEEFEDEEN
jgi:Transglycosylase